MTDDNTYISIPEAVEARQVTAENLNEIAKWCDGRVMDASILELDSPEGEQLCIEVSQTNYDGEGRTVFAYTGDWIVLHEQSRFMVYTDRYFSKNFGTTNQGLLEFVKEFVRSAMNAAVTPDCTKETFESCLMDISNVILATFSYFQNRVSKPDPVKVLPLVKDAMVGAIEIMSKPRVNEADTMNRMNAVASDFARKIASIE